MNCSSTQDSASSEAVLQGDNFTKELKAQWLSGKGSPLEIEGSLVQAYPEALCCVLEQNVGEFFSFKHGDNKCLKFKAVFFIFGKNHSIELDPIVYSLSYLTLSIYS